VHLASTFGERRWTIPHADSVVFAGGSTPRAGLFAELPDRHPQVHLLGDASAPRHMVFATRQAWTLAGVVDAMERDDAQRARYPASTASA
jgi:hypothetical protein